MEPVEVVIRYRHSHLLFDFVALLEWVFTPPNSKSLFHVGPKITPEDI